MTSIEQWAATAARGERFVYHMAAGPLDQIGALRAMPLDKRSPAQHASCNEAFDAWALYQAGAITLVQRRVGDGLAYEAVRL
jgi:hypothetical protein